MRETTQEFARRLRQAVESHERAPDIEFGRGTWLREELAKVGGVKVSGNAVHKWWHGNAMPRRDTIRAIAKTLQVDELWLATGSKPGSRSMEPDAPVSAPGDASAAALMVAGLIQMAGGRCTFGSGEGGPHLRANIAGRDLEIMTALATGTAKKKSILVTGPTKGRRIVALVPHDPADSLVCFDLLDLTDAPRQSLGGYSVIEITRRKSGGFGFPGQPRSEAQALLSIEEMAG